MISTLGMDGIVIRKLVKDESRREVPIDKFKEEHVSKPFNPILANMFYKAGFVESWGKGTTNIVNDCLAMNLPEPEYKYAFGAVQVTLYKTTPKTMKERLLECIKENKFITREELSNKLDIGINGVKQHIVKLKKDGVLLRVGDNRNGYWEVSE